MSRATRDVSKGTGGLRLFYGDTGQGGSGVRIDGSAWISVPAVLLNDYQLEQVRGRGWRLLTHGYEPDGRRVTEYIDAAGELHTIEVQG